MQQKHKFQVVLVNPDRRWDETNEDKKKGKFNLQQATLLHQSLFQYLQKKNLTLNDIKQVLQNHNKESLIHNEKIWTQVCSALTDRPLKSSYGFLMRALKNQNKKWKQTDEEQLIALQKKLGNQWVEIGKQMGRPSQKVRDKFRNLEKRKARDTSAFWKIEEIVCFLSQIEKQVKHKFLLQGIEQCVMDTDEQNKKQEESLTKFKYNSKFNLSPNIIRVMQFINIDAFFLCKKQAIHWKKISDHIGRNEADVKNKFNQLMEVFNRDSQGKNNKVVLQFIQGEGFWIDNFTENNIDWTKWDQNKTGFTQQEARYKWNGMKKRVNQRRFLSFQQIFTKAQEANQRKVDKHTEKENERSRRRSAKK